MISAGQALDARCSVVLSAADQLSLLEDLLSRERQFSLEVTGWCMRPWIWPGDEVVVVPRPDRLKLGQVVLVRLGEQLFIHRIVCLKSTGQLQTRGDRSPIPDREIQLSEVLGVALYVRRNSGFTYPINHLMVLQLGRMSAPILRLLTRLLRPLKSAYRTRGEAKGEAPPIPSEGEDGR